MDNKFNEMEKLYRAVYPPEVMEMFWRKDGTISSAAFADPKGLSVDRGDFRPDEDVVTDMLERFTGSIVSVFAKNCYDIGAVTYYLPFRKNKYHSEIHGGADTPLLSKSQRRFLAQKAVRVV
jgi:hypothetical protein